MRASNGRSPSAPTTATVPPPPNACDLWGFLACSHGWTWACWGGLAVWGVPVWDTPAALPLFLLGGLGLPAGGLLMTWRVAGRSGLLDLGRRLVQPGRLGGGWWLLAIGLFPMIKLLAGGVGVLAGAPLPPFNLAGAADLFAHPVRLLSYLVFLLFLGPLPEEVGWRGYLLDRLQLRSSALGASLLVGAAWATWHVPLFFITGYYDRFGGGPDPLPFGLMIVLGSILYTWVYNHTDRSVLGAVLLHFSGNVSGELLNATASIAPYETHLTVLLVLLVLWHSGGRTIRGAAHGDTPAPGPKQTRAERPRQ